jgi:hypothetical protein
VAAVPSDFFADTLRFAAGDCLLADCLGAGFFLVDLVPGDFAVVGFFFIAGILAAITCTPLEMSSISA